MAVNIEQMIADGVEEKLIFLASMTSASQFEKIAMNIKNPQIYQQFMALDQDAPVWDYAYAAGLISKADAELISRYDSETLTPANPGLNPGLNPGSPAV